MKRVDYDRAELERRRRACETELVDVFVWTNERVIQWVTSIGLKDYTPHLAESGLHGALIALDDNFDYNCMALALQIPTANQQVGADGLEYFMARKVPIRSSPRPKLLDKCGQQVCTP